MNVMYMNNKTGRIDANLLDQMISVNKIKMFMRGDKWVMVGIDHIRGSGGMYAGPDRRGVYGLLKEGAYRIVA